MHKMQHMTSSWLRKYANVNKHASYRDKMDSIEQEKNPYYLLEWLIFPVSDEEAELIRFTRSPSKIKNSYLDFTDVFFGQILYDIAFKASKSVNDWLFITAIHDLSDFYGQELWESGVQAWNEQIQLMWLKVEKFEKLLIQEQSQLDDKYQEQIKEIKAGFQDNPDEEKEQMINAREVLEQKLAEIPRKLLLKKFKAWPLVSYAHYNKNEQMMERLQRLRIGMLNVMNPPLQSFFVKHDHDSMLRLIEGDENLRNQLITWFPAYASKTLMTVEYINYEDRQMQWIYLLRYLDEHIEDNQHLYDLYSITFLLQGIDEVMMQENKVPSYFHRLVSIALNSSEQRKWLREVVILRYLNQFIQSFTNESYHYSDLSWVMCLDPESLEQKLIRGIQKSKEASLIHADLAFIIERVAQIYTDAIRQGMDALLMVPIFKYLTIHHIDFLYAYIQKAKRSEQFLPILQLDSNLLLRIFGGRGVRAGAARKALQPIFLSWLEQQNDDELEQISLRRMSEIYLADKGDFLQLWLDETEKKYSIWPKKQAEELESLLQFEWLGQPNSAEHEHEQIKEWLVHHSDWIKFDLDARSSHQDGVKYRILRPGIKDGLTGQVLARVKVRAEVTDPEQITSLLDDLKNL